MNVNFDAHPQAVPQINRNPNEEGELHLIEEDEVIVVEEENAPVVAPPPDPLPELNPAPPMPALPSPELDLAPLVRLRDPAFNLDPQIQAPPIVIEQPPASPSPELDLAPVVEVRNPALRLHPEGQAPQPTLLERTANLCERTANAVNHIGVLFMERTSLAIIRTVDTAEALVDHLEGVDDNAGLLPARSLKVRAINLAEDFLWIYAFKTPITVLLVVVIAEQALRN